MVPGLRWLTLALALASGFSMASEYPDRPIRLVVPLAAGGGADNLARKMAQQLSAVLGQTIVVDNKPGANGLIGAIEVANAQPDGYTFLITTNGHLILPAQVARMPFDPARDLVPVTTLTQFPLVLFAQKDMPGNSPKAFADHIRANPGKYSVGTAEAAGLLNIRRYAKREGMDILIVRYRGASAQLNDIATGVVHFGLGSLSGVAPFLQGGRVRAVAVMDSKRLQSLPNVPTLRESGDKDAETYGNYFLFAPGKTPTDRLERIQKTLHKVMCSPETTAFLAATAQEPVVSTVAQTTEAIRRETATLLEEATEAGIKPE